MKNGPHCFNLHLFYISEIELLSMYLFTSYFLLNEASIYFPSVFTYKDLIFLYEYFI